MRSWDENHTIRAWVLRDILRGRHVPDPDPHGLRLRGARIIGRLDLANLTTNLAVELADCLLLGGLDATNANLTYLGLDGCRLEHSAEPALAARWLTVTAGLSIRRAVISSGDAGKDAVTRGGAAGGWIAPSPGTGTTTPIMCRPQTRPVVASP
jgi:hypothetical protein